MVKFCPSCLPTTIYQLPTFNQSRVAAIVRGDAIQLRLLHVREAEGRRGGGCSPPPHREVFDGHDSAFGAHTDSVLDGSGEDAPEAFRERRCGNQGP